MTNRRSIPVEAEPAVSCDTCTAACCRAGTAIWMSQTERFNHALKIFASERIAPSDEDRIVEPLSRLEKPQIIPPGYGLYVMEVDCGYLSEEDRCTIHESPSRPNACDGMEVGSIACLVIRAQSGIEDTMPLHTRVIVDNAITNLNT